MEHLRPGDPEQIGGYRLIGRLEPGGMGEVFVGETHSRRKVVVKLLRPDLASDPVFLARFANEVAAARKVSGFYTAPVVNADPTGNPPWMAIAFIDGPTLSAEVSQTGPLAPDRVRQLGIALAEGLASIHEQNLVHRDLKPSNIILADDGPRIIDFGIARNLDAATLTGKGVILGTPGYMSPEQLSGVKVGPASDVFALGAVLAFAATGHHAFSTSNLLAAATQPPDLDGLPPSDLRWVIESCLYGDPAGRPDLDGLIALFNRPPAPSPVTRTPIPAAATRTPPPTSVITHRPGPHETSLPPDGPVIPPSSPLLSEGVLLRGSGATFSPDSRKLAAVDWNYDDHLNLLSYSLYLWDTGRARLTGPPITLGHDGGYYIWSPDSRMIVFDVRHSGPGYYRSLEFWDADTRRLIDLPGSREFAGHKWKEFEFSPDGRFLAAVSGECIRLFDAATLEPVGYPLSHEGYNTIKFSPNSRYAVATPNWNHADGNVYLFDCKERSPRFQVMAGCTGAQDAAFSHDSCLLALPDPDYASNRRIIVIDIPSGHRMRCSIDDRRPTEPWPFLKFALTSHLLAAAGGAPSQGGAATLLDLADSPIRQTRLDDIQGEVHKLLFSPDDHILAIQTMDHDNWRGFINFWDTTSGGLLASFETTINTFADFSPDGSLFVACLEDQRVLAWDTRDFGRKPDVLADEVPDWNVFGRHVAFSPDGRFVSITEPNGLSLWRRN